jgi:hypothetical protein
MIVARARAIAAAGLAVALLLVSSRAPARAGTPSPGTTPDGPAPSLSITGAEVAEGDSGTAALAFQVRLTPASATPVRVDFATLDGTALAGEDFDARGGTLDIPAGATTAEIVVTVRGDLVCERDEQLEVRLSKPIGAVLAESVATGSIENDDDLPSLVAHDAVVDEGAPDSTTAAGFVIELSGPVDRAIVVDYTTEDGLATAADHDYGPAAGSIVIPPFATQVTIEVAVFGDATVEADESFQLDLKPSGPVRTVHAQANGMIRNDDHFDATFQRLYAAGFTLYENGSIPAAWGDCDGDGDLDLPLYMNQGGHFSEMPGFHSMLSSDNYHGAAWCDYDRDGRLDLVILAYAETESTHTLLLHNLGGAQFVDVAPALGIGIVGHGETPVWGDFDGDGWPDLFAPYYPYVSPARSFLYHNNGDGTFTDVGVAAGVDLTDIGADRKPEGASAVDWDGDGDLDLYCASHLFVNDGTGHFTDVRAAVGLPSLFDEGAMFVDYDNDGDFDLYVRSPDSPHLFRNDGGHFVESTTAAGLPPLPLFWGDSWADVDHDGDLDLLCYVRNAPARLFLNGGDGRFSEDVRFRSLGIVGELSAWADFDHDGDLDVVAGTGWKMLFLNQLESQPGFPGSYLDVRVLDAGGYSTQQGAAVRLRRVDAAGGVQARIVAGGSSYLAQGAYDAHFGVVADASYALSVEFPSGGGVRRVVDSSVDSRLGRIVPRHLLSTTITIYRDGWVDMDGGVAAAPPRGAAIETTLGRPAPNPASGTTSVSWTQRRAARAELMVCDPSGRRLRTLVIAALSAGAHTASWDRRDERGLPVAPGVYFLALRLDGVAAGTRRVLVLR